MIFQEEFSNMQDFLHPQLSDAALGQLSALALAHIGDGVYELMTRGALVYPSIGNGSAA